MVQNGNETNMLNSMPYICYPGIAALTGGYGWYVATLTSWYLETCESIVTSILTWYLPLLLHRGHALSFEGPAIPQRSCETSIGCLENTIVVHR